MLNTSAPDAGPETSANTSSPAGVSKSLPVAWPPSGVSSGVDTVAESATGRSLIGCTFSVTTAVDSRPSGSVTLNVKLALPARFAPGVYTT